MPRSARINAIKSFRCYTIREATDVTGVSARTIGTWIREGLHVMKEQRPFLIRGDDLRDFIRKRRKARKTKTALHQFFCLGCRDVRDAAGGFAECRISGNRVALKALCNSCGNVVNKPVAKSHLPELKSKLELLETQSDGFQETEDSKSETGSKTLVKCRHQNRH